MKLEVLLSCLQKTATALCPKLDELSSHSYTLLIYSLILSSRLHLSLSIPSGIFPFRCSILCALAGLLVLVSCLANLMFLDLITICFILLGDI
jgi:hypothetical protein